MHNQEWINSLTELQKKQLKTSNKIFINNQYENEVYKKVKEKLIEMIEDLEVELKNEVLEIEERLGTIREYKNYTDYEILSNVNDIEANVDEFDLQSEFKKARIEMKESN